MKPTKRKICQAIALTVSIMGSSAALAQTPPVLLGGGSSLVAPLLSSEISIFPPADGMASYYPLGSGKGQTAFLNNDPTQFGAGVTGTVDFANTEAPLRSWQITAYQNSLGRTHGPLIQIPYIVTPIAIPLVNAPAGTGPVLPSPSGTGPSSAATVALNDDDLCGIFSGKLTHWNQVINPDNNLLYSLNAPITVVYYADNNGETDLLTAHLAQVCNSGNTRANVNFIETQHFVDVFSDGVPQNFVPVTGGSASAARSLASLASVNAAAISYLSPAYTNTFLAPSSAPAQNNDLSVASLRNTATGADVIPTYQNATTAIGGTAFAPVTKATAKVQANWVPNASNPTTGYPISGTSQIIVSQCYANPQANNPSPAQSIVDFLSQHYSSDAAIIHGNGFDTLPSAFSTTISNIFLSNSYAWMNLDIGNASVCNGTVTGR